MCLHSAQTTRISEQRGGVVLEESVAIDGAIVLVWRCDIVVLVDLAVEA